MKTIISTDPVTNYGLDQDQFTCISGWHLPIHNARALLMCGACNNPAVQHPIDDEFLKCDRTPDDINSEDYDYFLHSAAGHITLFKSYSGEAANIEAMVHGVEYDGVTYRIEDDPNYYVNTEELEYEALLRWSDKAPEIITHAVGTWNYTNMNTGEVLSGTYPDKHMPKTVTGKPNPNFREDYNFEPESRNVFIEATDGFVSRQYIDLDITERAHNRMLNSFVHKRTGKFHVGSIEFTFDGDNVIATCINKECYRKSSAGNYERAALRIDRAVADRNAMESFVYDVIRHGNNHGPDFIRNRVNTFHHTISTEIDEMEDYYLPKSEMVVTVPTGDKCTVTTVVTPPVKVRDYYKLHHTDCDLTCSPDSIMCNHARPIVNDVELNDVEFVLEHQRYCNDKNCKCDEWLANEVPMFAKENAA